MGAKPHIVVDSKKLKGKDYRDEIDSIIKPGEEDNLDFSDDELSQVLKMQVKKEPETEPLESDAKRMDGDDQAANDKLSASVPEDVSLNTPVSNPEAGGDEHDEDATDANKDDENNENADAAAKNNSNKSETRTAEGEAADAELEDGGDLEGSVTAESPPDNT